MEGKIKADNLKQLSFNKDNKLNSQLCDEQEVSGDIFRNANFPIFKELPKEVMKSITEKADAETFRKGNFIFQSGEPDDSVYIVKKGRIKLTKNDSDGNEYIIDILHDKDTISDNLFTKGSHYTYSAVCLSKVEVLKISKTVFLGLIADFPSVAVNLIALLSNRLNDANKKVILLSIHNPQFRLAGFLLDRDLRCVGPEIKLKLDDIAASIGLRAETVSRNLSLFQKQKLIKRLGKGRILVTDRDGLREIYEHSFR